MRPPAIKVDGLSKKYSLGSRPGTHATLYDAMASALRAPLERMHKLAQGSTDEAKFWALNNVNFEVGRGEILGIVGRNGAGKSTLLKILSRITAPTSGRIEVHGRLASLLEVGTGFHPELSGRENIYLNGAILGMRRAEITRKLERIIAFAEIDKFIDTPVKRYSSGMYVRLAFSVAAHLEPDILIIDEVLAVGDAEFQRKCLGAMEATRESGKTVIVVSHNMRVMERICERALWLDKGSVKALGKMQTVAAMYLGENQEKPSRWTPPDPGDESFQYESISITNADGTVVQRVAASRSFYVEFRYRIRRGTIRGRIALQVRNQMGDAIFSSANTDGLKHNLKTVLTGTYAERCEIPGNLLVPGVYLLTVSRPRETGDEIIEDICQFVVDESDSLVTHDQRLGYIAPLLRWEEI